ncbi:MAG: peptidase, partial [Cereibacter changlensis]
PTMLKAAEIIGNMLAKVRADIDDKLSAMRQGASASLIVAGQRKGGEMRMFLIYPEGNFIEATEDTPFLQIGEHKYGKPILDRVVTMDTSMADAQKAVLLSMDSTLRSNLSVGMPLDMAVIERDACRVTLRRRIEAGDEGFRAMSEGWSQALRDGFSQIKI